MVFFAIVKFDNVISAYVGLVRGIRLQKQNLVFFPAVGGLNPLLRLFNQRWQIKADSLSRISPGNQDKHCDGFLAHGILWMVTLVGFPA
jgi:hypothetical protein